MANQTLNRSMNIRYLNDHGVVQLLDEMVAHLLSEKPDDVPLALHEFLGKKTKINRSMKSDRTEKAKGVVSFDTQKTGHRSSKGSRRHRSLGFIALHEEDTDDVLDPLQPPCGIFGSQQREDSVPAVCRARSIALGLEIDDDGIEYSDDDGSFDDESSSLVESVREIKTKQMLHRNSMPDPTALISECINNKYEDLALYSLGFSDLPPTVLDCTHITCLDLSSNQLTSLPDELASIQSLDKFTLRDNNFEVFPTIVCKLPMLRLLYMDQNMISTLPEQVSVMDSLETLGLDWNCFKQVPSILTKLQNLNEVFMIENPGLELPDECIQGFGKITLAIDNSPQVVRKLGPNGNNNISVQYNKVYPDFILPGLYLGSLRSAQYGRVYRDLDIAYVASIGRELKTFIEPHMTQIQLNIDDLTDTNIAPLFDQVHEFIDKAIEAQSNCLVHCFKGQSRSATMVISYIMKKQKMARDEAIEFVKDQSPRINPNSGFRDALMKYECQLASESKANEPQ